MRRRSRRSGQGMDDETSREEEEVEPDEAEELEGRGG